MKLCFLGKIRGKNFWHNFGFLGHFLPPRLFTPPHLRGVNFFTKISQNRFWVMKLSFLGKIGEKFFDTNLGFWVKKIFYWSPAFRICMGCLPKYERNLLELGFENTTFRLFRDSQPLKRLLHTSSQMAILANFGQNWQNGTFFQKSVLNIFFHC